MLSHLGFSLLLLHMDNVCNAILALAAATSFYLAESSYHKNGTKFKINISGDYFLFELPVL